MIGADRGVLARLRAHRRSPLHVVDPFKVPPREAVLKAAAVQRAGLPFLLLASTDYERFDERMPAYVAQVKAAVDIPVITHFPPRPGAGLPVATGADALLAPALLGSTDPYFVWQSLLETLHVQYRRGTAQEELPEFLLEAALTFGDDPVSAAVMHTEPLGRTPAQLDRRIETIRAFGFPVVYLYSRFEQVTGRVCRYFRDRLSPGQLIFIGGNVRSREQVEGYLRAGADYVVFAGALERADWREELDRLCAAPGTRERSGAAALRRT
ncbi:geranylgeranylglyceryl/heptaprenylglyceryl phosphate synthase [Streptomyces sp. NPDC050617]|uniref:geranylgeranylglyceryl/heptaprenylglyceryl phosphate synthase n=1 Tax=Streptomyces sp. NPDC050617 TaxID=3154628 RepID=UPI0034412E9F